MGFKSDGIRWTWSDKSTTSYPNWHTTTTNTDESVEIKAPEWKIGDKIELNSPIDIGVIGEPKGWICPRCGRANAPWVSQCSCSASPFTKISASPAYVAAPCQTCSNNPANGGNGICLCTLGTPKVTC